jgi:putative phosphoribosyl transferase
MTMRFKDRQDAGRQLATRLEFLAGKEGLLVLGIPRGGVVIAVEISMVLQAPLDVFIARKLGAPHNPELAIGAIASSGEVVLDEHLISTLRVSRAYLDAEIDRQSAEIERRSRLYRGTSPPLTLRNKRVVLTDDGVATGATMRAAVQALQATELASLVVALPVGPPDTIQQLSSMVERLVCLHTPSDFWSVGGFYADFSQTPDSEVIQLLRRN